jgi:hypothetical protein
MYSLKFYTGDYRDRQEQTNSDCAICYVEHHFNSCVNPDVGYTVVIVGSNASKTSRDWGRYYAKSVSEEFGTRLAGDRGIIVGGYGGRGNANIRHTRMPAILVEPLFASNPTHAEIIRSTSGQERLARALVDSISTFFPSGGLVAFSVGHKYKRTNPNDRGAKVLGGGWEADYAEMVLLTAATMLRGVPEHIPPGPKSR